MPLRLMTLQYSQRGLTEDRTFIVVPSHRNESDQILSIDLTGHKTFIYLFLDTAYYVPICNDT
jgi:hypothetical protein